MQDKTATIILSPPSWQRWWLTFVGLFLGGLLATMLEGRPRLGLADLVLPIGCAWLITSGYYPTSKGTRPALKSTRLAIGWGFLFLMIVSAVAR